MRCNCDEDTRRSSTLTSYLKDGYTPRRLLGITTQNTQILRIRLLTRVETCFPLHATISKCVRCCFPTLFIRWNKRESRLLARGFGIAHSLDSGASAAGVITPHARRVVWNIRTAGHLVDPPLGVPPLCKRTEARVCMDRVASVPSSWNCPQKPRHRNRCPSTDRNAPFYI